MKRIRLLTMVAACSVVFTGCMRADAEFVVNPDGSGSYRVEQRIDRPAVEAALESIAPGASRRVTPDELADGIAREVIDGFDTEESAAAVSAEPLHDADTVGYAMTVTFSDIDEFNEHFSEHVESDVLVRPRLQRRGDTWRFDATFAGTDAWLEGSTLFAAHDPAEVDLQLTVSLPGRLTGYNGEYEDGTVRWYFTGADDPKELWVESEGNSAPSADVDEIQRLFSVHFVVVALVVLGGSAAVLLLRTIGIDAGARRRV